MIVLFAGKDTDEESLPDCWHVPEYRRQRNHLSGVRFPARTGNRKVCQSDNQKSNY